MMNLLSILLAMGTGSQANPMGSLFFMVAMIAVMYFYVAPANETSQRTKRNFQTIFRMAM
ncbi:MAG: hypothetical protein HWD58_01585 [Bacteroidota bacterium]|nr:MAG: hypothetical protein HWD58_01585 [Bacteroidota bacterium]